MCYGEIKTGGLSVASGCNFYPPGRLELCLFLLELRNGTLHAVPVAVDHSFENASVAFVPHLPSGSNMPNRETTHL
jgi:hypothetical protein